MTLKIIETDAKADNERDGQTTADIKVTMRYQPYLKLFSLLL